MCKQLLCAMLGILVLTPVWARDLLFSRDELLVGTRPMSHAYLERLKEVDRRTGTALRIERAFVHLLQQAKRLRRGAEDWDWKLVVVASDAVSAFALPDGRIFISLDWVNRRRLSDAEIALLVAHEMAHVIAEHLLERVSAFAAARPAQKLSVSAVLRIVQEEWFLARELEPLMQTQEFEADRIGMAMVCAAGIAPTRALTLFDKMARLDAVSALSDLRSHAAPLERKLDVIAWMQAENLACN
jgi:predicted Zn-dependent protease